MQSDDRAVASIAEAIEAGGFRQITSVLMARNGRLEYETYFDGTGPDTLHNTRSATKSVTAMALGAALHDGLLESVEQPVLPLFAEFAPIAQVTPAKEAMVLKDLLTMSSALACDDNDPATPGYEDRMHAEDRWTRFAIDLPTRVDYARDSDGLGPFAYCTVGTFLLGQVIESASGQAVDAYIEQRLFAPLDIRTVRWYRSPTGEVMTGGGTELRSRDLLKLGQLVLDNGRAGDQQILPAHWIAAMTTRHRRVNATQHYGYQWWHESYPCGERDLNVWLMSGNGGNKVAVVRELDMVAVITATAYGTRGMHEQTARLLRDALLANQPECRAV